MTNTSASQEFNFNDAIIELLDPTLDLDKDQIHIWGGEFTASETESLVQRLQQFLAAWAAASRGMPYRIWEYAHEIKFERLQGSLALPLAEADELLERARIFGNDGDLSLRRDGRRFLWHFIGNFEPAMDHEKWKAQDFFVHSLEAKSNPDLKLHQYDETALLWGECDQTPPKVWLDDRVGRAKLAYPLPDHLARQESKRVRIHYSVFTYAGQPAFVWWKELIEHGNR